MEKGFAFRVLSVVRRIPPGKVATYGDVAAAAGRPRAARAVGNIMRTCRDPGVPCHRVIAAAGGIGGYGRDLALKRALLRAEGLTVTMTRVRNFAEARWKWRRTPYDNYQDLDRGPGGYAVTPSTETRRGVAQALKKKLRR